MQMNDARYPWSFLYVSLLNVFYLNGQAKVFYTYFHALIALTATSGEQDIASHVATNF